MLWALSLVIVSKFLLGFAQVGEGICSAGGESCIVDQQQDVVVTIYSYDRPRYLLLLLEDIGREADRAELKVHVHVIDDNSIDCIYPAQQDNVYDSDSKYENDLREFSIDQKSSQFDLICPSLPRFRRVLEIVATRNWKFFSSRERHGKKRYWHQVAQAHRLLEGIQTRFFVFLPDDDRLCADFFRKAISAWEKIADTDKASLMLLVEEKRAKEAVWTPLKPVREGHVYRIGWVESGNFLCTYKLLELMNYSFPRIPSNRWDQRPTLSSGVGSQLSETLYKAKLGMFLTMSSLVAHVGNEESKMNSDLRASEQLNTYMFEDGEEALEKLLKEPPSVVATLATKWGRLRSLQSVVHSLACQVDKIHVYLNDYEFVPAFLRGLSWVHVYRSQDELGDIGDSGKFFKAGKFHSQYVITADDDLAYPPDYVDKLVEFIRRYQPPIIVGLHGIILREELLKPKTGVSRGYYASRKVMMGTGTVEQAIDVQILGTGLTMYREEDLPYLSVRSFKLKNMADIWFGIEAKRNNIPMVVMPHREGWVLEVAGTTEDSLYVSYTKRRLADKALTEVVLKELPWAVLPSKPLNFTPASSSS